MQRFFVLFITLVCVSSCGGTRPPPLQLITHLPRRAQRVHRLPNTRASCQARMRQMQSPSELIFGLITGLHCLSARHSSEKTQYPLQPNDRSTARCLASLRSTHSTSMSSSRITSKTTRGSSTSVPIGNTSVTAGSSRNSPTRQQGALLQSPTAVGSVCPYTSPHATRHVPPKHNQSPARMHAPTPLRPSRTGGNHHPSTMQPGQLRRSIAHVMSVPKTGTTPSAGTPVRNSSGGQTSRPITLSCAG